LVTLVIWKGHVKKREEHPTIDDAICTAQIYFDDGTGSPLHIEDKDGNLILSEDKLYNKLR